MIEPQGHFWWNLWTSEYLPLTILMWIWCHFFLLQLAVYSSFSLLCPPNLVSSHICPPLSQFYRVFFYWSVLKKVSDYIVNPIERVQKFKFKCQNILRVWHLVIFRADQSKKPPCMCAGAFKVEYLCPATCLNVVIFFIASNMYLVDSANC